MVLFCAVPVVPAGATANAMFPPIPVPVPSERSLAPYNRIMLTLLACLSLAIGDAPAPLRVFLRGGPNAATVDVVELTGPAQVAVLAWAGIRAHALVSRALELRPGSRVNPRVLPEHVVTWPAGDDGVFPGSGSE